jgi:peptide/nickel transport system substrate-binding protein
LKASDVVFTVRRAMESPYVGGSLISIDDVSAVDEYTVKFTLAYEYAPFLASFRDIYILNEKAVTAAGDDYGKNPVGTGPYKFVSHQAGQAVNLTRHDDYFKGAPPIKDVIWKVILNPATVGIAVEAGDIDLALNVPPGDIKRLEAVANLSSTPFELKSLNFMILNTTAPPFDNADVRKAVAYAVDRKALINMASDGFGTAADGIFNKFTFGFSPDVKPYPFDTVKAKELLVDAGYPDGFDVVIKTIDGVFESQAIVLQSNLAAIGIRAKVEMMDQAAYLNDLFSLNYEMGNLAIALGMDGDDWAMLFTSDGGMNMTGYENPELDRLFDEGRRETDTAKRAAIYKQAAQIVNDDAALISLYFTAGTYIHNKELNLGWIDSNGAFKASELTWSK